MVHRAWIGRERLLASRSDLALQAEPLAEKGARWLQRPPTNSPADRVSALWTARSMAREVEIISQDAALCSSGWLATAGLDFCRVA
jgi:hypothetical protein